MILYALSACACCRCSKNQVVAGKNDTEKRVYEALSNKNWGTSSTILNDIARDSYDIEKVRSLAVTAIEFYDCCAISCRGGAEHTRQF
jgi:ENTH domain